MPPSLRRFQIQDFDKITRILCSLNKRLNPDMVIQGKTGDLLNELKVVGFDFGRKISESLGDKEDSSTDYSPETKIIPVFHPSMQTTEEIGVWWQGTRARKVTRIHLAPEIIISTKRIFQPVDEPQDFFAITPTALVNVERSNKRGTTLGIAPLSFEAATFVNVTVDGYIEISKTEGVVGSGQLYEIVAKDKGLRTILKKVRNDVRNHLFPKEKYTHFEWEIPFKCRIIPVQDKTLICVQSAPEYHLRLRDVQSSVRIWDYVIQESLTKILEQLSNLVQQTVFDDSTINAPTMESMLIECYLRELVNVGY